MARPSQSKELRPVLPTDELPGEASDVRSTPRIPKVPGPPALPSETRALLNQVKMQPLPALGPPRPSLSLPEPAAENPFDREPLTGRTSLPSLPPPLVRFARFDVLGRIAVGGMAEIYLARESVAGGAHRHVAIKVVRRQPKKLEDEAYFEELFLREGRTAAQLAHPGICHVYEFGKWGGHFFIAMEWIDGVPLASVLSKMASQGKRLPITLALTIAVQVAAALDYAHRARDARRRRMSVVHRDVNPHNIMIRHDGVVKLLDFGIAEAADAHADSRSETVKGKFAYMAPEQARRDPLDGRADLFALGVCLFEMLSGTRLYRRETLTETLSALLNDPAPSLRAVLPGAPAALEATVQRVLAKDPNRRFQSAAELQAALETYLAQAGEVASSRKLGLLMEQLYPDARRAAPTLFVGDEVGARLAPLEAPQASPPSPSPALAENVVIETERSGLGSDSPAVELPSSTVRLPLEAQSPLSGPKLVPSRLASRKVLATAFAVLTILGLGLFAAWRAQHGPSDVALVPRATQAPAASLLSPEPQVTPTPPPSVTSLAPSQSESQVPDAPPPAVNEAGLNSKDPRETRRRPSPGFVASPGF